MLLLTNMVFRTTCRSILYNYSSNAVDYVTLLYHLYLTYITYNQVYNAKETPSLL